MVDGHCFVVDGAGHAVSDVCFFGGVNCYALNGPCCVVAALATWSMTNCCAVKVSCFVVSAHCLAVGGACFVVDGNCFAVRGNCFRCLGLGRLG